MKTNLESHKGNNVQKTILRLIAVVVSFVLISFTVGAQGYWKQLLTNNSFNEIATALVENSSEENIPTEEGYYRNHSYNKLYYLENANESDLELESWMTDRYNFGVDLIFLDVTEENLKLDKWMIDKNYFSNENYDEGSQVLESWMTEGNLWKI